jgi:hypothetical protein
LFSSSVCRCRIPLSIFSTDCLVVKNCFRFFFFVNTQKNTTLARQALWPLEPHIHPWLLVFVFLSWKIFISPSFVKNSFAGYRNLGWQLFSFRTWNKSFHFLLTFKVSVEKSVILMSLSLWMTWHFSLAAFNILCLFCMPNFWTIIWCGVVLFWSCLYLDVHLLRFGKFVLLLYWIYFLFL